MTSPKAVLISDIHYNMTNLALSDAALRQALSKAEELDVPLIIAGDLHDTKALMRAECINAIISTLNQYNVPVAIIPGNHDMINEKSKGHSLEFLYYLCSIFNEPTFWKPYNIYFIPYQHDPKAFENILSPKTVKSILLESIPKDTTIICHQGVTDSYGGHYVHDKSAVNKDLFDERRAVSGHYHRAQTIKCGETGLFSYIGSPFTMSFAEANDGPKGFQVLNEDNTLTFVPTNLRKHIVHDITLPMFSTKVPNYEPGDLLWVKLRGPRSLLARINKKELGFGDSYKLDLIPTDAPKQDIKTEKMTEEEILSSLVDALSEPDEHKAYLKELYRDLLK